MAEAGSHLAVGVIGLGNMGSALADALIANGFDITVWNRAPARTEPYARRGVKVAASVADAASASQVLVVCLLDHAATMSAVTTPSVAQALRGGTLLQLTTMTSDESREVSQWANKSGVKYLEGQIINYPDDIRGGREIIACAGPKSTFHSCQFVIEGMAGFAPHISETLGAAAVLDKALFEIAYPAFVGFLHGSRMCQAMGISVETFTEIAVMAYFRNRLIENEIASLAHRISTGDYAENVKAALGAYSPSFGKALRESEALGIDTEHLKGVDGVLRRACDAGHSRHDFAAVYEIFKPRKG